MLWSLVRTGLLLVALSFAWLVGSQAVRRAQSMAAASGSGAATSSSIISSAASGLGGGVGGAGANNGMGGNNGGPGATPSSEPREYKKEELPEKSVKNFGDVRGCDEAKEELLEVHGS